jgi:hypothetical protein
MRNMRGIIIRIRNIVSGLDALLLLMLNIALGELNKFLPLVFTLELCLSLALYPILFLICDLLAFKRTLLAYSTFSSFS